MGKGKDRTHPIVLKEHDDWGGVVIEIEGAEVASFSHDAIGWAGLDAVSRTIEAISRTYGIPVKDER